MRHFPDEVRYLAPSASRLSLLIASPIESHRLSAAGTAGLYQPPNAPLTANQSTNSRIQVHLGFISVKLSLTTGYLNVLLKPYYPSADIIHTFFGPNDLACSGYVDVSPNIDLLNFLPTVCTGPNDRQQKIVTNSLIFLDNPSVP
ncbi:MAG: hypothetical protein VW835_19550 [Rickettsiales bacterium]